MYNSEWHRRWWGRMGEWRSRAELEVLQHCQVFVNNGEVAFVQCCVWSALIKFIKKKGKWKWCIRLNWLCHSAAQQVPVFAKKKINVDADEESSTLSLCVKLAFYMDGGKSWGAFNNPLIHWGIQVVKRLSQMELGRASKYVLSSESAVSMVRSDFCSLVWREKDEKENSKWCFFVDAHSNTTSVAASVQKIDLCISGSDNSCFMVAVIDHIYLITIGWWFVLVLLLLLVAQNITTTFYLGFWCSSQQSTKLQTLFLL